LVILIFMSEKFNKFGKIKIYLMKNTLKERANLFTLAMFMLNKM